jgi:hypothetical protein
MGVWFIWFLSTYFIQVFRCLAAILAARTVAASETARYFAPPGRN